uniref:Uncharacterized protein n=1 Tax=Myoviridae sp. ct0Qb19 TaxID=2827653 RepID=A0A8S5SZS9_9CAUD|nr:MAG TPA: hypothetical protein [Myoviridae sp. ct0Qb19]
MKAAMTAINAKKSHHNPVGIVAIGYHRATDKYPSTIYIRMDDGEIVKYERIGGIE